jgi:hypothetical protein
MKKIAIFLVIITLLLIAGDIMAQCPMCKMTAESNLKNGGTMGLGLNAGILYMLFTPYLIVGALVYLWWRNKKNVGEAELVEE